MFSAKCNPNKTLSFDLFSIPSDSEPPARIIVTLEVSSQSFRLQLSLAISLIIDLAQIPPQSRHHGDIAHKICQTDTVSNDEPRRISRAIELCTNHRAKVSNGDLQTVRCGALRLSANVHRWPAESKSDGRVDTRCGEEHADVAYARAGERIGVAEEDAVADDGGQGGCDDERCTDVVALRDNGISDSEDRGEGIWWDCE
jgi:hypothetical protein